MRYKKEDFKDEISMSIYNLCKQGWFTERRGSALLLLHFKGVEVLRVEKDDEGFWKEGWWVMPAREACKRAREMGFTYVRKRATNDYWTHPTEGGVDLWSALKGYGRSLQVVRNADQ